MRLIAFSHIGKREVNQDLVLKERLGPGTYFFLIADGMGGYERGEVAARLVAENVHTFLLNAANIDAEQIQKAINKANLAIRQHKEKYSQRIGATVGGIILTPGKAFCFWVGDVKIFHFHNKRLVKESKSHTLMNEVIQNGSIRDPKYIVKYKHVVTRSVQGEVELSKIDSFEVNNITVDDMFVICSDGVHDLLEGIQIQAIINTSQSINDAFSLIEERMKIEAKDNSSLIAIQLDK